MTTKKINKHKTEVTLKKNHTHAGKQHKPGGKITVTGSQEAWLKKRGII